MQKASVFNGFIDSTGFFCDAGPWRRGGVSGISWQLLAIAGNSSRGRGVTHGGKVFSYDSQANRGAEDFEARARVLGGQCAARSARGGDAEASRFRPERSGGDGFCAAVDGVENVVGGQFCAADHAGAERGVAGAGSGGGTNLLSDFDDLFTNKLPINTPPDVQETTDADGVKVRKIKEKGKQHSFSMLDGLPSHGAAFAMSGYRQPEIPNVPTAKQQNTGMLNQQMMEQMMGQIMSMAGMFQGLMGNGGGGGGGGGMGGGLGNLGTNSVSAYEAPSDSRMGKILAALTPEMKKIGRAHV